MWTYNQNNLELYHHGVKGMKWGVRRAQRKAARAEKKAAKKQERKKINSNITPQDRFIYGELGARRIARDMVKKGKTREQAHKSETGRMIATYALSIAAGVAIKNLANGKIQSSIGKGKSKVTSIMQDRNVRNQTIEVLGENGKVLKKYKHGWSEAASTVGALVRR